MPRRRAAGPAEGNRNPLADEKSALGANLRRDCSQLFTFPLGSAATLLATKPNKHVDAATAGEAGSIKSMAHSQNYPPASALQSLAKRLANDAKVPTSGQEDFCRRIICAVRQIRDRDRRSTGARPGGLLIEAAEAARILEKKFSSMNKWDRDWVERIRETQTTKITQFAKGEIDDLEATIYNISSLLHDALGRPSRIPRHPKTKSYNVKDQMLRELVFELLFAASNNGGKFTFVKHSASGTLAVALDRLRNHVPQGLVPQPLNAVTIQRLKANFTQINR
jgi:hypothetical protein